MQFGPRVARPSPAVADLLAPVGNAGAHQPGGCEYRSGSGGDRVAQGALHWFWHGTGDAAAPYYRERFRTTSGRRAVKYAPKLRCIISSGARGR